MYNSKLEIRLKAAELAASMCVSNPEGWKVKAEEINAYILGNADIPEAPEDLNKSLINSLEKMQQARETSYSYPGACMGIVGERQDLGKNSGQDSAKTMETEH